MGVTGRIVIDRIAPPVAGAAPAKAIVGRAVPVAATVFRDGHGLLRVRSRWRGPSGGEWQTAPMVPGFDDRYDGSFVPTTIGRHEVVVDAWTDRFETWRRELRVRLTTGEGVEPELLEGAAIIDRLANRAAEDDRERLADAASTLRSTTCALHVRLDAGLDDVVARALQDVVDPWDFTESAPREIWVERERAAVGAWYEFFPRSEGGFAGGAIERLDAIAEMGFDVVYLPPIHPIGVDDRKGRGNTLTPTGDDPGSPWAIGSDAGGHTTLDPNLGTLADFDRFVERAAELGLEVALDYALQCSPDHPWVRDHPDWFHHLPDGSIRHAENPPKKYQDIVPIDFWPAAAERAKLWDACRDVLEFWIARGVRIFRVDNPHTKPVAFWEWLIPEVWSDHPEVVFLSEAFTAPPMMYKLAEVGFSQSYTYFTWRESARELREYVEELAHGPHAATFRPNFWPNTPDILAGVLRHGTPAAFRIRAVLAALLSPSWGIYSGYELCENQPASPDNEEYHDSEKYRLIRRDWSQADSLAPFIAELNRVRHEHPSCGRLDTTIFHDTEDPDVLAWSKHDPASGDQLLVVVTLDPIEPKATMLRLDLRALGLDDGESFDVTDELTGEHWTWFGWHNYVRLDPGERVAHVFRVDRR
jgi:starch synthase (maltosyl-transferring)